MRNTENFRTRRNFSLSRTGSGFIFFGVSIDHTQATQQLLTMKEVQAMLKAHGTTLQYVNVPAVKVG
jgi:hypothetical protein